LSHGTKFALPKQSGGLGVKKLHVQNICLLLKFCYKTLHATQTPRKLWITSLFPFPISQGLNISFLGKNIFKHLDTLRSITQCTVRNGQSTFFCLDRWIMHEPLSTIFPALFSYRQEQHALVNDIMQVGVQFDLRNRLTAAVSFELSSLLPLLQVI
jgi:hypothetical protein